MTKIYLKIFGSKKSNPFELEIEPGIIIAYGNNENELDNIQTIFINDILKNQEILQKIVYITNKKYSMEKEDISNIRKLSFGFFSKPIVSGQYDKTAKCCPKFWKLYRSYFLPF